jgi:uncharacterized protein YbcC (UPF0753/DUF2309 family)
MTLTPEPDIFQCVKEALEILTPLWPLQQMAATNPLHAFTSLAYAEALSKARELRGVNAIMPETHGRARYQEGVISTEALESALADYLRTKRTMDDATFYGVIFKPKQFIETALTRTWEPLNVELEALIAKHAKRVVPREKSHLALFIKRCDLTFNFPLSTVLDEQVALWCAAYLDRGIAEWSMPHREEGLFNAWRRLAVYDSEMSGGHILDYQRHFADMPNTAAASLIASLNAMHIEPDKWMEYLLLHALQAPGWASSVLWHSQKRYAQTPVIDPIDYFAIRLWYENALVKSALTRGKTILDDLHLLEPKRDELEYEAVTRTLRTALFLAPKLDVVLEREQDIDLASLAWLRHTIGNEIQRSIIWLDAEERCVQNRILGRLAAQITRTNLPRDTQQPAAELFFCMDTRAEPLRRAIERQGPYKTHGFTGSFGLSFELQNLGSSRTIGSHLPMAAHTLPVIEHPFDDAESQRALTFHKAISATQSIFEDASSLLPAAFALTEVTGPVALLRTVARTFFPQTNDIVKNYLNEICGNIRTQFRGAPTAINREASILGFGFAVECDLAYNALCAMNLLDTQAPLIFLIGHTTSSPHLAFRSAFACGSCSGQPSGVHSRIMGQLLNNDDIRLEMKARGAKISEHTLFIAGEHDTASDALTIFDLENVPADRQIEVMTIHVAIEHAAQQTSVERLQSFTVGNELPMPAHVRINDWSQTLPELGFAGHEGVIIGPRKFSEAINLEGHFFLHDYHCANDDRGEVLAQIFSSALLIAHNINSAYAFALTDPQVFSSGHLLTQNIVGGFGVTTQPRGDLRVGLPEQALHVSGVTIHQPLRLFTLVVASQALIELALAASPLAKQLIQNHWINLVAWDTAKNTAARFVSDGTWQICEIAST